MTGSSTAEHTPDKYKAEIAIMWTIVGIPLAYGLFNAIKAALQLFTG
ncbi:MAG: MFS transporter small subunit [Pseudonocardiaceae bacterium]